MSRRARAARLVGTAVGAGLVVAQLSWAASVVRAAGDAREPWTADGGLAGAVADTAVAGTPGPAAGPADAPAAGPVQDGNGLAGWARRLAPRLDVPAVALAAYGRAQLRVARDDPSCHLSWVALAGIGRIESDHGRFRGAVLGEDGRSTPPVVGIALDGDGVATIRDTDGGRLDGDTVHDRAVGPMQFIPSTWRRWGADGDGDGAADPFDVDDAALAAGRYLCAAGGGDLRTPGAWTRAVLAYNASGDYLARVTATSNGYAAASR